jgi:membrane-associated phospholipid phosphatase
MNRSDIWRRTLLTVCTGTAVLTLLPFVAFLGGRSLALDRAVTNWLHSHSSPGLTQVMKFVSTYAYHNLHWWLIGAVGLYFLWRKRSAWELGTLLAVRYGSNEAQELIKQWYGRPRPALDWVKTPTGFSYPSGTVTVGAAVCLALAYVVAMHIPNQTVRRIVIGSGWFLASLVALSRIYLGAHWLTDTVAALSLAAGLVTLALLPARLRQAPKAPPVEVPDGAWASYAQAAPSEQK